MTVFHRVAALLVVATVAHAQPTARPTASLAWLAGCWEMRAGRRVVEEQWTAPAAGVLLGRAVDRA